ncbi:MAG: site-2 protease family protein [Acidobacteria bacterium]|nr:site-2 protease family protein [Acidobacteriota bacterium]MCI0624599.1 site-2 protease family protein [Acidobacteriota bacterium]MCI0723518.1 site-2 protease family protein [Acidobacteriota bacterium]
MRPRKFRAEQFQNVPEYIPLPVEERKNALPNPLNEVVPVNGSSRPSGFDQQPEERRARRRLMLQSLLFVLTVLSTWLLHGWAYSACLILILLFHEMGHYFAARSYGVPATLPYFIPFPLALFGTFGAVIKMQGIIPNRRALFDIGIMGPVMGLVVALPATVIGIGMSKIIQVDQLPQGTVGLGDSILFSLIAHWIHGPLPQGHDLLLHPIGFAGWAGLFVTAINLLPMGQLDGGHIVYALFQQKSVLIYRLVFLALAAFTVIARQPQWIFFLALTYFLIRLKHPPTLDEHLPVGGLRFALGIAAMVFFAITFPPNPVKLDF